MIMVVPGVIFDLCNCQNSVTFIETFKMTPIITNLNVFSFIIFSIGKQEDRIREEFRVMVIGVFDWSKHDFGVPTYQEMGRIASLH
jgi:hypothetical protein